MKEFAPGGANSFLLELIPNEMVGKTRNKRVAFPESLSIYHNHKQGLIARSLPLSPAQKLQIRGSISG